MLHRLLDPPPLFFTKSRLRSSTTLTQPLPTAALCSEMAEMVQKVALESKKSLRELESALIFEMRPQLIKVVIERSPRNLEKCTIIKESCVD